MGFGSCIVLRFGGAKANTSLRQSGFFEMLYLLGLWRERMSHEDKSFIHLSMHGQQSSGFRDALCKNKT
jgi:hypothetical protein